MKNYNFLFLFAFVAILLGLWALIHYSQVRDALSLAAALALLVAAIFAGTAYFLLRHSNSK